MSHLDTAFSRWLRAPRTSQTPAEAAYAIQRPAPRRRDGAAWADIVIAIAAVVVLGLIFVGWL